MWLTEPYHSQECHHLSVTTTAHIRLHSYDEVSQQRFKCGRMEAGLLRPALRIDLLREIQIIKRVAHDLTSGLLAFFMHTLNRGYGIERLVLGRTICTHIIVIVWTNRRRKGNNIEHMAMTTCATQHTLTCRTIGHAHRCQWDGGHKRTSRLKECLVLLLTLHVNVMT
jgi:hypothetical protein